MNKMTTEAAFFPRLSFPSDLPPTCCPTKASTLDLHRPDCRWKEREKEGGEGGGQRESEICHETDGEKIYIKYTRKTKDKDTDNT